MVARKPGKVTGLTPLGVGYPPAIASKIRLCRQFEREMFPLPFANL